MSNPDTPTLEAAMATLRLRSEAYRTEREKLRTQAARFSNEGEPTISEMFAKMAEQLRMSAVHTEVVLAAAARAQALEQSWRTIETAPKDRRILVYGCEFKRHWFGTAYWFQGVPGDGEGWITSSFYTMPVNDCAGGFTPTHWMPLPGIPVAARAHAEQEP